MQDKGILGHGPANGTEQCFSVQVGIYPTTYKTLNVLAHYYRQYKASKLTLPKIHPFLKQVLDQLRETVLFQTKALTAQLNESELICLEKNNGKKAILNGKMCTNWQ